MAVEGATLSRSEQIAAEIANMMFPAPDFDNDLTADGMLFKYEFTRHIIKRELEGSAVPEHLAVDQIEDYKIAQGMYWANYILSTLNTEQAGKLSRTAGGGKDNG